MGDFVLQNEFMATFKAEKVKGAYNPIWFHVLFGHSMIHGLGAYLATGNVWIGMAEVAAHFAIDYSKSSKLWVGFHTDQALHIGCKIIWAAIVWWC